MADRPFGGAVRGFLTPAMVDTKPDGTMLNAFTNPDDVDRISAGYACGNCCASFHTFQLDCPVCHQPTHVTRQREQAPVMWQQHVDQRNTDIPTLGPGKRERLPDRTQLSGPGTFDSMMAGLRLDRDVDTMRLSQLRPSKRGRGRVK